MEGICVNVVNPVHFFGFLKGRCHGNQFCGKVVAKLPTPALITLPFQNRMGYRHLNVCVNSVNDVSILCENFTKFGPVTPELILLICERQLRHGKNWHILVKYLQIYWTDFRNLFTI